MKETNDVLELQRQVWRLERQLEEYQQERSWKNSLRRAFPWIMGIMIVISCILIKEGSTRHPMDGIISFLLKVGIPSTIWLLSFYVGRRDRSIPFKEWMGEYGAIAILLALVIWGIEEKAGIFFMAPSSEPGGNPYP